MMKKLNKLKIDQLLSFGYIVRSNKDREEMEKKQKLISKIYKPKTSKKPIDISDEVEDAKNSSDEPDDFSYLDDLET